MRIGFFLYRLLTRLLAPAVSFMARRRVAKGKDDPAMLHHRFAKRLPTRPLGRLVWMHGASVGESKLLLLLADALEANRPDLHILHTCQTLTGAKLIMGHIGNKPNRTYAPSPIDTPAIAHRFIDHWRPEIAIFAEGEIWPNLLFKARKEGAKTALINARMTDKSLNGWARWPDTAKMIFGQFDLIAASDERTAQALKSHAPQAFPLPSNLKTALSPPQADENELQSLRAQIGTRPILLAASTHPGEEELVLNAIAKIKPSPFLILAPRHPERGDKLERLCHTHGYKVARRQIQGEVTPETDILLADTIGEMGLWIRLAQTVYLGGGHTPSIGGHNPLEAIRLGKPVLTGPDVFNFRTMMDDLQRRGGVTFVKDAADLALHFPAKPPSSDLITSLEKTAAAPLEALLTHLLPLLPEEEKSDA